MKNSPAQFGRKAITKTHSREQGVALLFVILLTSVLLLVAIGISNISYRETTFSIEAQDSDTSFFSADTGIECGLYLDNQGMFGGTSAPSGLTCDGIPVSPILVSTPPTYQFALQLSPSTCAQVDVDKAYDGADGSGADTYISAVGYNVGASGPDVTSGVCVSGTPGLRVVTRGLSLQYANAPVTPPGP